MCFYDADIVSSNFLRVPAMIHVFTTNRWFISLCFKRCISSHVFKSVLNNEIKKEVEEYWIKICKRDQYFDKNDIKRKKFYSLSMFPYPSGNLHMGHVRVYTISDVIARFHRMNGKNVFQPIGWDAFGLPAENAAIDRGIPPHEWTYKNISQMKEQLKQLQYTFDWQSELATCSPDYYKWTQYLFLKMYEAGLVYQKESLVNWDPIDCTVLAEEQVDSNGCSWRSGAKVEKKKLKQWFIRTTKFSKALHDGLNAQTLLDWDDIIVVQKNWIGECDGYSFDFKIKQNGRISDTNCLNIWVREPTSVLQAAFIVVRPNSLIDCIANHSRDHYGKLDIEAINPFTNNYLPVYVSEEVPYPDTRDVYVGVPSKSEFDKDFAERIGLTPVTSNTSYTEEEICKLAQKLCIGGYPVSSKIQDWLISRQRYWGTPIPLIHCKDCGVQPVPFEELPVILPSLREDVAGKALNDFLKVSDWKNTTCPKCNGDAFRDTDTMDTFVDSSWYYLRYTDVNNLDEPFNENVVDKFLPVDLYVGGKEHAVLHLYYARFFSHFLHSIGLIKHREPFQRLLCQGMVKGPTYKTNDGKYLKPNDILIEGQVAKSKATGEVLNVAYEKMSKSRYNGVDPKNVIDEYGIDTTRLLLLYKDSPKSHCEWNKELFNGVLKWQNRLWMTMGEFITARENPTAHLSSNFNEEKENAILKQARNKSLSRITYNYQTTQQLMSVIRGQQELTSALRVTNSPTKAYCEQFERALGTLIITLSPIIPHFAATLWYGFCSAPKMPNINSDEFSWDKNVFEQKWPLLDEDAEIPVYCQLNDQQTYIISMPRPNLRTMTPEEIFEFARKQHKSVQKMYERTHILNLKLRNYDDLSADLYITAKLKEPVLKKASENKTIKNADKV